MTSWCWLCSWFLGRVTFAPTSKKSIPGKHRHKLASKFYGPFRVLSKIKIVAYHLDLPTYSKIHDVFHVSLLKPFHGESPTTMANLPSALDGEVLPTLATILRARLNRGKWEVLVQWTGLADTGATWEDVQEFYNSYPTIELEEKLFFFHGRGNVMDIFVEQTYVRHRVYKSGTTTNDVKGSIFLLVGINFIIIL